MYLAHASPTTPKIELFSFLASNFFNLSYPCEVERKYKRTMKFDQIPLPLLVNTIFGVAISYVLFVIAISAAAGRGKTKRSKKTLPPPPPPLVKGGMIKAVKMMIDDDSPWLLLQAAKDMGTPIFRLSLPAPGTPMVALVGEYDLAREILLDPLTTKAEVFYRPFDGVTGGNKSVFTTNGEFWHLRRKGLAPAFSSKHIKRMNTVALEKTDEWIETRLIPYYVEKGESFDIGPEMIGIILGAISKTAFEYDLSKEEKEMFLHELHLSLDEFKRSVNPLRVMFGLFLSQRRRAFVAGKNLQSLALKIMASYRAMSAPTSDTIIDRIMKNDAYKNDDERAADLIVLLVAGYDTTAYSISWIMLQLAKHPKEQQVLRESLRSMSSDEWSQSPALRNVVKEGIRMYPVSAGGAGRLTGRDFTTKDGYLLPKGSAVIVSFMNLLRDESVFPDADSFSPSRWDNPTDAMNKSYLPFACGKQNCVGQSLANAEIHCMIPRIISEFELEVVDEGKSAFSLTLKPVGTLLRAKKISS
jgi:cytochrome P450